MIRVTALIAVITIINSVHGFSIDLQKENVRLGRAVGTTSCTQDGNECDADNNEVCNVGKGFCVCGPNFVGNGMNPVICLAQLGGACDPAADPADCMPGQACQANQDGDNVCACDPAMNLFEDGGECIKGIGAFCGDDNGQPDDGECTGMPNMICDADNTVCDCKENFRRDNANNGPMMCIPSVGATCGTGQGDNGADITCDLDNQGCFADAANTAANNDGGDTCQCNANFGFDPDTASCVPGRGAACGVGVAAPFTQGDDGCNLGSVCMEAGLGAPSADGDAADDICGCNAAENMVADPNRPGWCVATVGGSCEANGDDDCPMPNQECQTAADDDAPAPNGGAATNVCGCNDGSEDQPTADNAALNECVLSLGGACAGNDALCQVPGSECDDDNECQCVADRIDSNGADTAAGTCDAGLGGSCANGVLCAPGPAADPLGLTCNADEECVCDIAQNLAANDDGECVNTIGGDCEANGNDDCPLINQQCQGADGSEAAEGGAGSVCGCATPFVDDGNGQCVRGAGAACDADNPCGANMNLICDDSDAAAPVCAPGVGGNCAADANCPFANQQCVDDGGNVITEGNNGVATCQCAPGSEAGDNPLLCDAWTTGFCQNDACGIDQGDCNGDDGCEGDLACGINNCPAVQERPLADCCYDPATVDPATACTGGSPLTWSCCRSEADGGVPCGENQGDCDDDDDCAGDLVCGANMCNADFNTAFDGAGFFPAGSADCCVPQATVDAAALFYKTHDESGYDMRKEYWQNYDEPQRQLPKY